MVYVAWLRRFLMKISRRASVEAVDKRIVGLLVFPAYDGENKFRSTLFSHIPRLTFLWKACKISPDMRP